VKLSSYILKKQNDKKKKLLQKKRIKEKEKEKEVKRSLHSSSIGGRRHAPSLSFLFSFFFFC
jgi:hypothetical protein